MAQQVIPAAQLVLKYHTIRRCNSYVVLQSIPCSPECKIVGQMLLNNLLIKVPGRKETIKFMLDTQQFVYTLDMFRDILHLPMETPNNLFVALVNVETIEAFMNRVGYQGVIDKVSAFYTKKISQPWQTMFKVVERDLDNDDSKDRLEPESHKDNPEHFDDDNDKDKEKMKRSLQDQANDIALWEVLKSKFENSSIFKTSCKDDDIHSHHDNHQEDDASLEGEKKVKRHKALKRSKSAMGSSSKHSSKDLTTYVSKQQQQQQHE
nr:hypothetical protein [Tanacetum cinerariifolium]